MSDLVILAYSGGLDTSVLVQWIKERHGLDVVAFCVDLGQPGDLDFIRDKALRVGAVDSVAVDAREEFLSDWVLPLLHANGLYEGRYPLATALARPLIARMLVEEARRRGARAVAHGCTGKGNDQVRFDLTFMALAPELEVIAPLRGEMNMSREEEIEYAQQRGIPVPTTVESPYSVDENLWGRSCEAGVLEDPWNEPPEDAYTWTVSPAASPDAPAYVEIEFEAGTPVALDGRKLPLLKMVEELNLKGGEYGVGRVDMIENRLVGIKSREVYEAPAATILIEAHRALETLTLTREALHFKPVLEAKYSQMVYFGQWYEPLREALQAAMGSLQESVTGTVRVKLFKGTATVVGRKSPRSLYDYGLATYDKADAFDHQASKGFIELWGLPMKIWGRTNRK